MSGNAARVAVVTGASSGIGKEVAKILAGQGWHVIAHGRDPGRSAEAAAEIRAAAPGARVDTVLADLCLLSEVTRMVAEITALTDRVDLLVANAGGVRDQRIVTAEGNEATFAGNHLGHFLLTTRLLPQMRTAAAGQPAGAVRIVNVSSRAHMTCQGIDWADPQLLADWTSVGAYGVAKLANILFARELAKRLAPDGIVAHAVHPGVVASNFASHGTQEMQQYMAAAQSITPREAAEALVWVATAPEAGEASGLYWADRAALDPSPLALDAGLAERLWTESEALVARAGV